MNSIGQAFYILTLCFYFTAAAVFIIDLRLPEKDIFPVARLFFLGGFLMLTLLILGRVLVFRYFPLYTFHETLLFLAWAATLVLIFLERAYHFRAVCYFAPPLLFLFLFAAFFFPPSGVELWPELRSAWLLSHILTVIAAYAAFAVSFVVSLMYLLTDHHLKKKRLSSLVTKLPSLDTLDFYIYRLVAAGFFLLTISIFLGAMWAQNVWGAYWRWEPKEIWSLITWVVYAAYLHTRLMSGWQGRKVAMLNSFGFATVLFNYVIVRFFFSSGLHQFY